MASFKPNILIVDDSRSSLALISDLLGGFQANLIITQSAKEALSIVESKKIHVIISDVNMPEMDGFSFAKALRSEERHKNIPLILVSGSFTDEIYQNLGLKLGAIDYINKSSLDVILPQKVKNLLEIVRFQYLLENDINDFKKAKDESSDNCDKMYNELVELRALSSFKSQVLMMLFQKIRSPLSSLMGIIAFIDSKDFPFDYDTKSVILNEIKGSVSEINEILESNALSLKAFTQQLVCDFTSVKINDVIPMIIDDLSSAYPDTKIATFYKNIEDKEFLIDQYHLKIIVDNLLCNAIKYSGNSKEIKIIIEMNNLKLKLSVQDFGSGILESNRNDIFEPFKLSDNKVNINGAGMGLAIVKNIVQALNGEIYFDSEIDKGTTFYVIIPLNEAKA